uniref:Uncharacterized protein n=1 Tax=Cacopsylla melanoneura TaxID=428564 RepID=A0A8D8XIA2_9HEMI
MYTILPLYMYTYNKAIDIYIYPYSHIHFIINKISRYLGIVNLLHSEDVEAFDGILQFVSGSRLRKFVYFFSAFYLFCSAYFFSLLVVSILLHIRSFQYLCKIFYFQRYPYALFLSWKCICTGFHTVLVCAST